MKRRDFLKLIAALPAAPLINALPELPAAPPAIGARIMPTSGMIDMSLWQDALAMIEPVTSSRWIETGGQFSAIGNAMITRVAVWRDSGWLANDL